MINETLLTGNAHSMTHDFSKTFTYERLRSNLLEENLSKLRTCINFYSFALAGATYQAPTKILSKF